MSMKANIVFGSGFTVAIEAAPNGMILTNSQGRIELVNTSAEHMFGYNPGELLHQSIDILVPQSFRQHHPTLRNSYMKDLTTRKIGVGRDLFAVRKDGTELPVEIGINAIKTEDGIFVLVSVLDITVRKLAEVEQQQHIVTLERERHIATLERKNKELDEFTYVASHDLQEPLRNILSYVTLLKQDMGDTLPDDAADDLKYISDAARRMKALVESLLELSRAGRSAMKPAPVSLDECVDDAIVALTTRVEEAKATISRATLPTVHGDKLMLTQLYQNLIGNAVKFRNSAAPQIELTAEQQNGTWVLGVQDNGIGVDPQYAEQILAPFQRLHGMAEYEGTGIGLSICQKTVERHGGRIWIESELGQSTHVRFTLPETGQVTRTQAEEENHQCPH